MSARVFNLLSVGGLIIGYAAALWIMEALIDNEDISFTSKPIFKFAEYRRDEMISEEFAEADKDGSG